MSFSDTYQHEVYLSRKDRARRALFWAKITSFVLLVTVGATLRAEPELRRVIMTAGMDAVTTLADLKRPDASHGGLTFQAADVSVTPADNNTMPASRIKVNRFGASGVGNSATVNTTAEVQAIGAALSAIRPGG